VAHFFNLEKNLYIFFFPAVCGPKIDCGGGPRRDEHLSTMDAKQYNITYKRSTKGCISFYGLRKLPISLYPQELAAILKVAQTPEFAETFKLPALERPTAPDSDSDDEIEFSIAMAKGAAAPRPKALNECK
jgi:hypothetical protein